MSAPGRGLSQVVIRSAEPEDLPVLGQLGALLVRLHHEFDPARFVAAPPRTEHLYAAFLADQLRKPNGVVLVAEMGGEVLGYTYASVEDSDYMALRGPPCGVVPRNPNDCTLESRFGTATYRHTYEVQTLSQQVRAQTAEIQSGISHC